MAETEDVGTYVKLYRSTLDHDLLDHDNSAYIVFTKLLLKVDHKTGKYRTGRFKLSELTNLKPSTAWDALKRLELAKMVKVVSNNQNSVIYICNWPKFQAKPDNKPTTNRQQTDTLQEVRNKNIYRDFKKGIRPAEEFKPSLIERQPSKTKERILELKAKGVGFKQIAQEI